MALDSLFYINTKADVAELRAWLIEYMDYKPDTDSDYLLKTGVFIHLSEYNQKNIREQSYEIYPTICIYFWLDKFEGFEQGYRTMIETVLFLIEYQITEAIMYDSGGKADLIFRDGKLILHKGSWGEQDLLLIKHPYVIEEMEDK